MSIAIHCECGKSFSLPDRFSGWRGNCTDCDAEIVAPERGSDAPDGNRPADASNAQLSAFAFGGPTGEEGEEPEEIEQPAEGEGGDEVPEPAAEPTAPLFEPTRIVAPGPRPTTDSAAELAAIVIDRRSLASPREAEPDAAEPAPPSASEPAEATDDAEPADASDEAPERPRRASQPASKDAIARKVASWKEGSGSRHKRINAEAAAKKKADASADSRKIKKPGEKKRVTIGHKIGDYEVDRRLGEERSTVFLATAPDGTSVALKVLPQQIIEASPTVGKRFLRAARSLFGLRHANVATYRDAGEELGNYFVAMEHVTGRSLKELLRESGGRLSEGEVLGIARGIAAGLGALHGAGLIHRNLKPEHVLITPEGEAKLIGLGLVRPGEPGENAGDLTVAGTIVGTPEYLSPEQARVDPNLDGRADLYSLGALMFEMLTGGVPFEREPGPFVRTMMKIASDPVPDVRQRAQVSDPTAKVVEKLLAKKPADRYQTGEGLAAALERIQKSHAGGERSKTPEEALYRNILIALAAMGVLTFFLIIALIVTVVMLYRA